MSTQSGRTAERPRLISQLPWEVCRLKAVRPDLQQRPPRPREGNTLPRVTAVNGDQPLSLGPWALWSWHGVRGSSGIPKISHFRPGLSTHVGCRSSQKATGPHFRRQHGGRTRAGRLPLCHRLPRGVLPLLEAFAHTGICSSTGCDGRATEQTALNQWLQV